MKQSLTCAEDDLRAHYAGLTIGSEDKVEPAVLRLLREISQSNLFGDSA